MKTEIIKAEDYGLETSKATELTSGLKTVRAERELLIKEFEDVSKLEISQENLAKFRELRLKIVKNRTQGIIKWHKTNKEFFLTGGKFVDAIKNKEIQINEEMESKLMDAEKHFENLEKERIEKLNAKRVELVKPYVDDVENLYLADMEDDVFEAYLLTKKNNHEAKLKAEAEAEEARLKAIEEEKKEQERIRKENAKLKAEAEERERLAKIEEQKRLKAEQERKAKEEAEKKKQEAEAEKKRAEYEAKLKAEREEKERIEREEKAKREKLEAELKAKQEAELKAKQEEEARIQAELNKGDADKVKDLIKDLESIKTKYSFKSAKNKKMYNGVGLLIDKVTNFINK